MHMQYSAVTMATGCSTFTCKTVHHFTNTMAKSNVYMFFMVSMVSMSILYKSAIMRQLL